MGITSLVSRFGINRAVRGAVAEGKLDVQKVKAIVLGELRGEFEDGVVLQSVDEMMDVVL